MSLDSHPFLLQVLEVSRPLLVSLVTYVGESRNDKCQKPLDLNESEYFNYLVMRKSLAIVDCFERLRNAVRLITMQPIPTEIPLTPVNWADYHYGHYLVKYCSIFDLVLLLTNSVFHLGIPDKECKMSVVLKNEHVVRTSVKASLDEIKRVTNGCGDTRNRYVHRNEAPRLYRTYESSTLDDLDIIYRAAESGLEVDKDFLDKTFENEIVRLASTLVNDIDEAEDVVAKFLTSLIPVYTARLNSFPKNNML